MPTKAAAPKKATKGNTMGKEAKVAKGVPATKSATKAAPVKTALAKPIDQPASERKETKPTAKPVANKTSSNITSAPKNVKKAVKKEEGSEKESSKQSNSKPLVTQIVAPNRPVSAPVVKKQVSTLESADKLRYSDEELEEFRDIIMKKLDEARKDYDLLKQTLANTDNNGTDDTSPSFKMIEDGSETLSREETAQLAGRQEKFIKHLEDAQLRIRNKTYGICRVTGRL
ncbi:MAG: hypothetical protein M3R08_05980, partial [Bacteroidota bacterium]|nr:hypothetical protein [Bacteroidota bacterium]